MGKFIICTKIQTFCPPIRDNQCHPQRTCSSHVDKFVQFLDLLIYSTSITFEFKDIPENVSKTESIQTFSDAISAAKSSIDEKLTTSSDTYDKLKEIHDYLCNLITYKADNQEGIPFDQTAYSALVEPNETVCAGYTTSFKLLCDKYNIPCIYVSGYAGEAHAWNFVQINSAWYAVDVTWDDQTAPNEIDKIYYDFFLVGSETVAPGGWNCSGQGFSESNVASNACVGDAVYLPYPMLSEAAYDRETDIAKPDLKDAIISEISAQNYTGMPIEPDLEVKFNNETLDQGSDYTVLYSDNTNAGTATVTVTGTGSYTGTVEKTFTIEKANTYVTITPTSSSVTVGGNIDLNATVNGPVVDGATVTYSSSDTNIATVDNNGKVTGVAVGAAAITATYAGDDNHNSSDAFVYITVSDKNPLKVNVTSPVEKTYGDESFTLEPSVAQDSDATFTYAVNGDAVSVGETSGTVTINKAGTAFVTVTATDPYGTYDPGTATVIVNVAKKAVTVTNVIKLVV